MEVVVFGAGSLGCLLGGLLARRHEVTLVGREALVEAVRESGLRVEGVEDCHVTPDATTDGTGLSADLAVVTVKAYDTPEAARTLATGSFDAALPLSNGLGNAETLADHLSCPVLGGTTTYGAVLSEPGRVSYLGRGTVTVGARGADPPPAERRLATRVAEVFREAGIESEAVDDIDRRLWEKLAVNAAINPVTALGDVRNGAIVEEPLWDVARAACEEAARAARASGVSLSDEAAVAAADEVARATADNRSSMAQDLSTGRRTEVEAITGRVVEVAGRAGFDVPVSRALRALVLAREGRE